MKLKKTLIRITLLITLVFTLSSCGLFYGRGWGCDGPHYYDNRGADQQYRQNYDNS